MTTQPNTGPNRLRQWADGLQHGPKPPAISYPQSFRDLAAAWEADRNMLNSETARADAAELRANVLSQRDETETMNIGAALFAVILRDDTGAGEMPAGPCADVLTEWRRLRAEINDLRASGSLLANQMRCIMCGVNLTVLLACPECGIRYELVNQDTLARHMSKLHVYEQASKLAPPFAAQSFEAVQVALEQRDTALVAVRVADAAVEHWKARAERAEAALERARALVPMVVAECVQKHTYSRFGVNNRCEFCGCSNVLHLLAAALAPDDANESK